MDSAGIGQFIPLILIFVIFYFFLIRPQQKKVKEHKAMVESLKKGDKIVTSGGITGTISTFTLSEIWISSLSFSITLSTVPIIPPEVITWSPLLRFSTIILCSLTFFCCGLIKKK